MPVFDLHMIIAVLGVAVLGGLLGLDRTAAGQFMVSQPIVAGPLTGWILGDTSAGFVIGAVLELIWLLDVPVGSFVPANATVGAVSATGIAVLGMPGGATLPVIGFSVLLTAAIGPLTMGADSLVRTGNSKLIEKAVASTVGDRARAISRAHLSGLVVFFLKSFVLCVVIVPAGVAAVLLLFDRLPGTVHRALALFVKLLPIVGAALVARKLSIKEFDRFVLMGFVIAAVFGLLIPVPSLIVVLFAVTAGWIGARYSEHRA